MRDVLIGFLLADAGIAALVQNRVHWLRQPDQVSGYPYVNLQGISDPDLYHMKGAARLRQSLVQADCWALTYGAAWRLNEALSARLSGFRGQFDGPPAVSVSGVFITGRRDDVDTSEKLERPLFRVSLDFQINWLKGA